MDLTLKTLTIADLEALEGQGIAKFCSSGRTDADNNHCAHFVSHALGIGAGLVCSDLGHGPHAQGASVRANEVFNYCTIRGVWDDPGAVPAEMAACNAFLMFTTVRHNVSTAGGLPTMGDYRKKHVGICTGGKVWNYSNPRDRVVCDSVARFRRKFLSAYGTGVQFYYGYRVDI